MKTAYELAMERMNAEQGPARQLSDSEKEAIAEIDRKFDARLAEARMGFDTRLAQAANYEELQALREEMTSELKGLEEKREIEKDRIWSEDKG